MLIPPFNIFRDCLPQASDQVGFFRLTPWMMSENAASERDELVSRTRIQIVERRDWRQYCGFISDCSNQKVFEIAFCIPSPLRSVLGGVLGVRATDCRPRQRDVARDLNGRGCDVIGLRSRLPDHPLGRNMLTSSSSY